MSNQQTPNNDISVKPLQLPKGGGAIQGFGESLGSAGPSGTVSFTVPLPVSPGRGYAPNLALSYNSGAGNDVFGLGWGLPLMQISRRSNKGVPEYTQADEFIGPSGEPLVPERDGIGELVTRTCEIYDDKILDHEYTVTRYFPRIESAFDLIEYWYFSANENFWLIHQADGQLHCLGKTSLTRTAAVSDSTKIAEWWLQESISATGEHICYQYKAEDNAGIDLSGQEANRERGALSYLAQVKYGNKIPEKHLYAWDNTTADEWLFSLVFDYGERLTSSAIPPEYTEVNEWLVRTDSFSHYQYGFEARCHRLCRQVLMYHHFPNELTEANTLVGQLMLHYDQNPVTTLLSSIQQWAYDTSGTPQTLPPLALEYSTFDTDFSVAGWQEYEALPGVDNGTPYQMVDLYGEGIAGLLFKQHNGWYYREPIRGIDQDSIIFDTWQPVTNIPSLAGGTLIDITGDGKLDWVVTQSGMNGFFSVNPDKTWTGFTPFAALPLEFFHPQAQLADLMGDGLADITMIGPKSVRLYKNDRGGYEPGEEVSQATNVQLPVIGRDNATFVGFSDLLGSGQQHVVQIKHNEVTCWPNLGLGHFASAINFVLANEIDTLEQFNPNRIYLFDLDGSGADDLVYAQQEGIAIYLNRSGNGFCDTPILLPYPADIHFDDLCQLSASDVQGHGTASLILSKPYHSAQHWKYSFCLNKPYLLSAFNNNMGAKTQIKYRSSVQFWLDEKSQSATAVSSLPFPVHLLHQAVQTDEVTGNRLSQEYRYRRGVYDGKEREFRGFGFIETQDTNFNASASDSLVAFSPPLLTKTWYHTGKETDEAMVADDIWDQDPLAYQISPTRLTQWESADVEFSGQSETRWWLYRALNGRVLHQESYGLDGSDNENIPFSVASFRYQSRLCQNGADHSAPVVVISDLENLSYQYERIIDDPQSSHQVTLVLDQFAMPLQSVAMAYPRRDIISSNYPESLPDTALASAVDEQQQWLRISEQKQNYYHLENNAAWQLGVPWQQRSNERVIQSPSIPAITGYNFEALTDEANSPLTEVPIFAGQQVLYYTETPPTSFPVLLEHTEVAELDEDALTAYDVVSDRFPFNGTETLDSVLAKAGYLASTKILGDDSSDPIWVIPTGFTTYHTLTHFYLPQTQRATTLQGMMTYSYDSDYHFINQVQDELGNSEIITVFDYRFLSPVNVIDMNQNTQAVAFDALGQVVSSTFYGTEAGSAVGFEALGTATYESLSVAALIALSEDTSILSLASLTAYEPFSWMGEILKSAVDAIEPTSWNSLMAEQLMLQHATDPNKGYITALGHTWALSTDGLPGQDDPAIVQALKALIIETTRIPVHTATLIADNYPTLEQQKPVGIGFNDGFGRSLQTSTKVEPGMAYQRDENGELITNENDELEVIDTTPNSRWRVSGRVEYNNKGLTVRVYQPYFVDDWQYVVDRSMRAQGHADTLYYDALSRESYVETAKGYLRRASYYPWFSVAEDENDTFSALENG